MCVYISMSAHMWKICKLQPPSLLTPKLFLHAPSPAAQLPSLIEASAASGSSKDVGGIARPQACSLAKRPTVLSSCFSYAHTRTTENCSVSFTSIASLYGAFGCNSALFRLVEEDKAARVCMRGSMRYRTDIDPRFKYSLLNHTHSS
jgi:hypothetical protein